MGVAPDGAPMPKAMPAVRPAVLRAATVPIAARRRLDAGAGLAAVSFMSPGNTSGEGNSCEPAPSLLRSRSLWAAAGVGGALPWEYWAAVLRIYSGRPVRLHIRSVTVISEHRNGVVAASGSGCSPPIHLPRIPSPQ